MYKKPVYDIYIYNKNAQSNVNFRGVLVSFVLQVFFIARRQYFNMDDLHLFEELQAIENLELIEMDAEIVHNAREALNPFQRESHYIFK